MSPITTIPETPTLAAIRQSAIRILGPEYETVWTDVCSALGIPDDVDRLDHEPIDGLLTGLANRSPVGRVIATSWKIRRTAALKLAELGR